MLPRENVRKGIPQPVNGAVHIREVPARTVAVVAFSGYPSDQQVEQRERKLRDALAREPEYRVVSGAAPEIAQVSSPLLPMSTPYSLLRTRTRAGQIRPPVVSERGSNRLRGG